MRRSFASEDSRKTKLFDAWNPYLDQVSSQFTGKQDFSEIYEGMAQVWVVSENQLSLRLTDRKSKLTLKLPTEITRHTERLDLIYLVLGLRQDKWHTLEVVSVGSLIGFPPNKAHITVNPVLMKKDPPPAFIQ